MSEGFPIAAERAGVEFYRGPSAPEKTARAGAAAPSPSPAYPPLLPAAMAADAPQWWPFAPAATETRSRPSDLAAVAPPPLFSDLPLVPAATAADMPHVRSGPVAQASAESSPSDPATEASGPGIPIDIFGFKPFGEDGLTFADLVDIVNPLQHIPIVSSIYRRLTGDTIDPVPRIAGSGLLWGPIGVAVAAVNAIVEWATGKDMGDHAIAFLMGEPDDSTQVASAADPEQEATVALPEPRGPDPSAPFLFTPPAAAVRRTGFVPAPVAQEALPADIVAALQPGKPLNPMLPEEPEPLRSKSQQAAADGRALAERTAAEADAFAAVRLRRDALTAAERKKRFPGRFAAGAYDAVPGAVNSAPLEASVPGAAAAGGGWFSTNLLDGLAKYQASSKLGETPGRPTLDLAR